MQQPREWAKMSETAKIAWLWNETNEFIEMFLSSLTVEEYIQIRAEDMFSSIDEVRRICNFVGIEDISIKAIRYMLHQQVNQQTTYIVEPYTRWSLEQKALVARYVPLVSKYGYNLQNGKG
jgi:hypothetical protein